LDEHKSYEDFFQKATGRAPYDYQLRLALHDGLPEVVNIPTGLGKTAAVVLAWLWRRRCTNPAIVRNTPRRLVYCLPMRVLVEQTESVTKKWLNNLGLAKEVDVHVLMGGEETAEWDVYPERDAILIGTQDMLLSRALNRGYAASRARWPMQFGLLHNDCLWVFDEIQLMGSSLATTAQLEAFRNLFDSGEGQRCRSIWMSATMQPDWLKTVDFASRVNGLLSVTLGEEDPKNKDVMQRWTASKPISKAEATIGDAEGLAAEVLSKHKAGTRSIVVVNTVKRAQELFKELIAVTAGTAKGPGRQTGRKKSKAALQSALAASKASPRVILLHSRFRLSDRRDRVGEALNEMPPEGTIIVSTQVIEAGVDISATTLFTELAPWASMVQRFGRCNRDALASDSSVWWVDLRDAQDEKSSLPYEIEALRTAREHLRTLQDVAPRSLPVINLPFQHGHVIRRKDLIELFDTTPDLAGNDIDVDRFVRETDETDVRVFWRDYGEPDKGATPNASEGHEERIQPSPKREELCPAPVGEFRDFVKKHPNRVWRWRFLEGQWEKADPDAVSPGQVFLVHADAGGYSAERGWDAASTETVAPVDTTPADQPPEATDDDRLSESRSWQTLADHTERLCSELNYLLSNLPVDPEHAEALRLAARWHDRGKAHAVFQHALPDGAPASGFLWAKAAGTWHRYQRRHFRHEVASALAVLDPGNKLVPDRQRDLVAYLVAAHHGKVRLSIRSLPNEQHPDRNRRFARGIWDGDQLPPADLGSGVIAPEVTLSLEPMELGLCEHPPFAGQPSWAERMLRLRDTLGPFRLAYLEAILRAADIRASRDPGQGADRDLIHDNPER
jgi:CRISPR-associated endonuclease/helicase Cas3